MLSAALIFPLIYLYIRSIILRRTISLKDTPHFVPAVLFFAVATFLHILLSSEEQLAAYKITQSETASLQMQLLSHLNRLIKYWVLIQIVWYFVKCTNLILQLKRKIHNYFSKLETELTNWTSLFYFIFVGVAIAGAWLMFVGDNKLNLGNENMLVPAYLFLSIVLFVVSYIANHKRDLEHEEFHENISTNHLTTLHLKNSEIHTPAALVGQLDMLFEKEKPYLNPQLKITDISQKLKSNRTYVSAVIKDYHQTNFSRFVNSWRVKEAEQLLKSDKYKNYTTRGIAEMAGFHNYNTFIKAFRETYKTTPANFRSQHQH